MRFLRRVGAAALNLLLPPQCALCDAEVSTPGGFCPECVAEVRQVGAACCMRCGVPVTGRKTCPRCMAAPPPWGRARGALAYDAVSRRVILPLKHADRTDLAQALAGLMVRAGRELLDGADLLVPVPLHRGRLFARRYNQAALLALAVGRLAGVRAMPDALCRVRATGTLAGKDYAGRAREMAGAIVARPSRAAAIAGRRIVLVDDVLTSGATCGACTQALLGAGAASVDVLVAVRALGRDHAPGAEGG